MKVQRKDIYMDRVKRRKEERAQLKKKKERKKIHLQKF